MYLLIFMITILVEATVPELVNRIDEEVDGVLIKRTSVRNMRALGEILTCPANTLGNVCADDCQTLLACQTGTLVPLFTIKCSETSSDMSYCIPGSTGCTNLPDHNNPKCINAQVPTFACTNIGYFPDPKDCTLYHICSRETQETYQCPPQHVFDVTNTKCRLIRHHEECFTINCADAHTEYVTYPGHKSYYAHCNNSAITMFKCDDINHLQFNPKTLSCDFVCKESGWFPDYKNCQQYYECYKTKSHSRGHKWFKSRIQRCPQNFKFDRVLRQCVEGECIKRTTPAPELNECEDRRTTPPPPLILEPECPNFSSTASPIIEEPEVTTPPTNTTVECSTPSNITEPGTPPPINTTTTTTTSPPPLLYNRVRHQLKQHQST